MNYSRQSTIAHNLQMTEKTKKIVLFIISAAVSLGMIAWLLSRIDYQVSANMLGEMNPFWLGLSVVFMMMTPFFCVIRFCGVIAPQKKCQIKFVKLCHAVLFSGILNSFLPGKAGDAAKIAVVYKYLGFSESIGITVLERMVDFFILGLLCTVGSFWSGHRYGLIGGGTVVVVLFVTAGLILFFPLEKYDCSGRFCSALVRIQSSFRRWARHPLSIFCTFLGAAGKWILAALAICALATALDSSSDWAYIVSIYPVAVLAGLVPFTLGGVGPRDSAFVYFLSCRMVKEQATIIGLGYTLLGYWSLIVMALLLMLGVWIGLLVKSKRKSTEP